MSKAADRLGEGVQTLRAGFAAAQTAQTRLAWIGEQHRARGGHRAHATLGETAAAREAEEV